MTSISSELLAIAPIAIVSIVALVVLFIEAVVAQSERISFWVSVIGLLLSAFISFSMIGVSGTVFNSMITVGGFGALFAALFSIAAFFTVVLSRDYLMKEHASFGECYLLILFSTMGMMMMAAAADLIIVFLGLELMSICLYVLAGFFRTRPISNEASLKYFLLGAFATGFLLYGIAFLYGASGTTNIAYILEHVGTLSSSMFFWLGIGLFLVGLSFKVGAVPFHMWVPDVYQGSPTTISGFMATGAKAAAFAVLVLIFSHQHFENTANLKTAIALLSAASMIVGNVVAISQSNIKRMLAYSSIAHAGYMLMGIAAANQLGRSGIMFYLVTYMFMNIGAFGILSLFERQEEKNLTFDDYSGFAARRPLCAALLSVFILSLAGLPPFAGFIGKYYVFSAAINAHLTWLVIIGVLTSVVSVYYYLRLVMVMYFRQGEMEGDGKYSYFSLAVLSIAACAVIGLGIYPSSLLTLINNLY